MRRIGLVLFLGLLWSALPPAAPARAAEAVSDTVPSNLWLTRSLLSDLAARYADVLGPGPRKVLLAPLDAEPGTELLRTAISEVLLDRGNTVYLAGDEDAPTGPVDARWSFRVVGVELSYPEVGRTLGLWRSWIARRITVTVQSVITEEPGGRLLLDEEKEVKVADRFPAGDFERVDSPLYAFTTAEPVSGGWHGRLEEMVVLGTLAGLVAVYFANTSD